MRRRAFTYTEASKDRYNRIIYPEKEIEGISRQRTFKGVVISVVAAQGLKRASSFTLKPYHYSWHTQSPSKDCFLYHITKQTSVERCETALTSARKLPRCSSEMIEALKSADGSEKTDKKEHCQSNFYRNPSTGIGKFREKLLYKVIPAQRSLKIWGLQRGKEYGNTQDGRSKQNDVLNKYEPEIAIESVKHYIYTDDTRQVSSKLDRTKANEITNELYLNFLKENGYESWSEKTKELLFRTFVLKLQMEATKESLQDFLRDKDRKVYITEKDFLM